MDRSARGGARGPGAKGEDKSIAYAGEKFTQSFYGGEVQLRYPTRSGSPQWREPRRAR